MFLPDRYIKGTCPKCGTPDQYGDACENCSSTYAPTDLVEPYSTLTGARPELRASEHLFFQLSAPRIVAFLKQWTSAPGHGQALQPEVLNKIREWLGEDGGENKLADWDISRDEPYFGIPIPDHPGKYFYVWLDAPIGYLASLKAHLAARGIDFAAFLQDPAVEQFHFIGKDIVYFHTLFWPAMLEFAGKPYRPPDNVFVHGFITFANEKMSKSRGTGISPDVYLDLGLNPEWLRYYIAAKLNAKVEDLDFNPDDFMARVNSDLIGKYVNIASRAAPFLTKYFDGRLSPPATAAADAGVAIIGAVDIADEVAEAYEAREFGRALRLVMGYADRINEYFDAQKPWELAKDPARRDALHRVCSECIAGFYRMTIMLKPVLPARRRRGRGLARDPRPRVGRPRRAARALRRLPAPDGAHRREADGRAARRTEGGVGRPRARGRKDGPRRRPRLRHPRPPRKPRRPRPRRRRSPSTISPRSSCASRASSTPSTYRAPTSC